MKKPYLMELENNTQLAGLGCVIVVESSTLKKKIKPTSRRRKALKQVGFLLGNSFVWIHSASGTGRMLITIGKGRRSCLDQKFFFCHIHLAASNRKPYFYRPFRMVSFDIGAKDHVPQCLCF